MFKSSSTKQYSAFRGTVKIIREGYFSVLFLFAVPAIICYYANFKIPESVLFTLSVLSIAPFAEALGFVTEQIAEHTSETLGGLLNATFGNATELIVSIVALLSGLHRVVILSLLGSIISNLLLVLGTALWCGAATNDKLEFKPSTAVALMTAAAAIIFITVLSESGDIDYSGELLLSRVSSVILFILYCLCLVFELTQKTPNNETLNNDNNNYVATLEDGTVVYDEKGDDEEIMGFWSSLLLLAVVSTFIAVLSEIMVDSIEKTAESVSGYFLAAVVIPIIGNAAEHTSSIKFAIQNRPNISLGIAVGSANQIALSVLPILVILGWALGRDLSLHLQGFDTAALFFAILLTHFVVQEGTTTWLLGAVLVFAYLLFSAGCLIHFNSSLSG